MLSALCPGLHRVLHPKKLIIAGDRSGPESGLILTSVWPTLESKGTAHLLFEILSGIALDLKNRAASHQFGNFSPPSTKLSLHKNTTQPSCILAIALTESLIINVKYPCMFTKEAYQSFLKQFFFLFGPTSRGTRGWSWCLRWRPEHPTDASVNNWKRLTVFMYEEGTNLLLCFGFQGSINFPDVIMNLLTCQVVSSCMISGLITLYI